MSGILVAVLLVATVAVVMVALALLAMRIRRRGSAGPAIGAAMAAYDEAMHATAYDTFVEMQEQTDRKLAVPSPDDI